MTEQYLRALIDGLRQKEEILDKLTEDTEKQFRIVSDEKIDWEAFDSIIDDKASLIDKLNVIDEGFQAVFDRIKDEVKANQEKYRDHIAQLQYGIQCVTEKSTSLMALEERTRAKVSSTFGRERKQIVQTRSKNRVANSYYNNMNRMNYIDPQLMDKKK